MTLVPAPELPNPELKLLCGEGLELGGTGDEDCLALSESESPNSEEDEAPLLLP